MNHIVYTLIRTKEGLPLKGTKCVSYHLRGEELLSPRRYTRIASWSEGRVSDCTTCSPKVDQAQFGLSGRAAFIPRWRVSHLHYKAQTGSQLWDLDSEEPDSPGASTWSLSGTCAGPSLCANFVQALCKPSGCLYLLSKYMRKSSICSSKNPLIHYCFLINFLINWFVLERFGTNVRNLSCFVPISPMKLWNVHNPPPPPSLIIDDGIAFGLSPPTEVIFWKNWLFL